MSLKKSCKKTGTFYSFIFLIGFSQFLQSNLLTFFFQTAPQTFTLYGQSHLRKTHQHVTTLSIYIKKTLYKITLYKDHVISFIIFFLWKHIIHNFIIQTNKKRFSNILRKILEYFTYVNNVMQFWTKRTHELTAAPFAPGEPWAPGGPVGPRFPGNPGLPTGPASPWGRGEK